MLDELKSRLTTRVNVSTRRGRPAESAQEPAPSDDWAVNSGFSVTQSCYSGPPVTRGRHSPFTATGSL